MNIDSWSSCLFDLFDYAAYMKVRQCLPSFHTKQFLQFLAKGRRLSAPYLDCCGFVILGPDFTSFIYAPGGLY